MSGERKFQVGDVVRYDGEEYEITAFSKYTGDAECFHKKDGWVMIDIDDLELVTPVEDR